MEWEIILDNEYKTVEKRTNETGLVETRELLKQKWHDENPPAVPEPQPTETELLMDYVIDVDYRVTMIELGL